MTSFSFKSPTFRNKIFKQFYHMPNNTKRTGGQSLIIEQLKEGNTTSRQNIIQNVVFGVSVNGKNIEIQYAWNPVKKRRSRGHALRRVRAFQQAVQWHSAACRTARPFPLGERELPEKIFVYPVLVFGGVHVLMQFIGGGPKYMLNQLFCNFLFALLTFLTFGWY